MSDPDATVATPLAPVARPPPSGRGDGRAAPVAEYGVGEVIVGLPRTEAGEEGAAAAAARADAASLLGDLGVTVRFADERYTTRIAAGVLREAGVRRSGRRRVVDKLAAAVMLQGELDRLRNAAGEAKGDES